MRSKIVAHGSTIVCPKCVGAFSLSPLDRLAVGAKPWPWWVFLLIVLSIMGVLNGVLFLPFLLEKMR